MPEILNTMHDSDLSLDTFFIIPSKEEMKREQRMVDSTLSRVMYQRGDEKLLTQSL
jgi:hypothetical protein